MLGSLAAALPEPASPSAAAPPLPPPLFPLATPRASSPPPSPLPAAAHLAEWRSIAFALAPFSFPQLYGCPPKGAPRPPAIGGKPPPDFIAAHGEDAWLASRIFAAVPAANLSSGGTFVEVGAADGLRASPTLFFERQRGWRGLLLEGHPQESPRLRTTAASRARSAVFTGGVCGADANFNLVPASLRFTPLTGSKTAGGEPVPVHCLPLQLYLDATGLHDVDLLALDVGGGEELAVLETVDWAVANVRVVLVALSGGTDAARDEAVRAYLGAHGFVPSPAGVLAAPAEIFENPDYERRLFARRSGSRDGDSGAGGSAFMPGYRPLAFKPGTAVPCARSFP